jgi:hypothetical protein
VSVGVQRDHRRGVTQVRGLDLARSGYLAIVSSLGSTGPREAKSK